MRRISILYREDLVPKAALKQVKDIHIDDLDSSVREGTVGNADILVFYCSLLNKYKILKNRYGHMKIEERLDTPEDENTMLRILIGV
jgi:hypothetical protein